MYKNFLNDLKINKTMIGVWGNGYIGFSTMLHFATKNFKTIGFDPNTVIAEKINKGLYPVEGLEKYININFTHLVDEGLISSTNEKVDILNPRVQVHFIAVPTEKQGNPWLPILKKVIQSIAKCVAETKNYSPLIIIESTLVPGTTDKVILPILKHYDLNVGRDLFIGISPRRDWFVEGGQEFKGIDRIYSGIDSKSAELTFSVLSLICDRLHKAESHFVGEMVKPVENALRHISIALANQVSLAYPKIDVREVFRLAGTKWNIEEYHPSFGCGGYCIPLSGKYIIEGAVKPKELSLLKEAIKNDNRMRERIASTIINKGCKNICILGLSYRGNMKVSVMSPTLSIVQYLISKGIKVKVYDPYYTAAEIYDILGVESFVPYDFLKECDGILLVADHTDFKNTKIKEIIFKRKKLPIILDNYALWKDWNWPLEAPYFSAGNARWIE